MTDNTSFTDGAVNVAIADGMIRIEFGVLSFHEKTAGGKPKVLPQQTMVMTPQGFLRTLGNMERALNSLVEAGVVASRDPGAAKPGPAEKPEVVMEKRDRRGFGADRRRAVAPGATDEG